MQTKLHKSWIKKLEGIKFPIFILIANCTMSVMPFSFVQSNLVFISTDITSFFLHTGVTWGALVGDCYKLVTCAQFELNGHYAQCVI